MEDHTVPSGPGQPLLSSEDSSSVIGTDPDGNPVPTGAAPPLPKSYQTYAKVSRGAGKRRAQRGGDSRASPPPTSGGGFGVPRSRPAGPVVFQHGGCCVRLTPWLLGLIVLAGVSLGCLLLAKGDVFHPERKVRLLDRMMGVVSIVGGFLLPSLLVFCCAWWKTPPRQSFFHDSLLEQMLAGDIGTLYDVDGESNAGEGTILVIGGATTSRNLSKVYSSSLASTCRVIRVDLPGHGVMHAVAYSLSRCERVLTRVLDVTAGNMPVLILAHGAGSYAAMHFAYRCPERVSGLLCVGDIPDYLSAGVFTGWFHRVYNLEWARYFTNNLYKRMISLGDLPEDLKKEALRDDFNLDGLPQIISELKGEQMVTRLQEYRCACSFLCTANTTARLQKLLRTPNFSFRVLEGVHSKLPPTKVSLLSTVSVEAKALLGTVKSDIRYLRRGSRSGTLRLAVPAAV